MVSSKASCHDITCESIPGSPLPFLFFVGARGEPGNEANFAASPLNTNASGNFPSYMVFGVAILLDNCDSHCDFCQLCREHIVRTC